MTMQQPPPQPPPQTAGTTPTPTPILTPQPMMTYGPGVGVYRPPTFRRIKVRHVLFKVGVAVFLLAVLLFVVGYAAPDWGNTTGLWMSCVYDCASNVGNGPAWLDAVRALESIALICFLVSIAVFLYQDVFKSPPPPDNKVVELLALVAAILGLISVAIFGAKLQKRVSYPNHDSSYYGYDYYYYINLQWGYALNAAGSILALLAAVLLAVGRVKGAAALPYAMQQSGAQAAGVYGAAAGGPAMVPMQPMMQMQSMMQPMMQPMQMPMQMPMQQAPQGYYPYMPPQPNPYAYPYPTPGATPMIAPPGQAALPPPTAVQGMAAQPGLPASSQVPAFYVMTQGQMVPVYNEMPVTTTPAVAAAAAPAATAQAPTVPAEATAPDMNGDASYKM